MSDGCFCCASDRGTVFDSDADSYQMLLLGRFYWRLRHLRVVLEEHGASARLPALLAFGTKTLLMTAAQFGLLVPPAQTMLHEDTADSIADGLALPTRFCDASASVPSTSPRSLATNSGAGNVEVCASLRLAAADVSYDSDPGNQGLVELGHGSDGVVYQGKFKGEPVAIKSLMSLELQKVEKEVSIAQSFRHPNIVDVIGITRKGSDRCCVVMQLLAGGALNTRLAAGLAAGSPSSRNRPTGNAAVGPLNEMQRLQVAMDIVDGLIALHGGYERDEHDPCRMKRIIHRDLKPGNVVLTRDLRAVICDFGGAKAKSGTKSTVVRTITGTQGYMAPEVVSALDARRGSSAGKYDERVDIFSLAIMLYEMFGIPCAWLGDPSECIKCKERPDPSRVVDADMRRLIVQCWQEDFHERPTAVQVRFVLEAIWLRKKNEVIVATTTKSL